MKRKDQISRKRLSFSVVLSLLGAALLAGCATMPANRSQQIDGASVSYSVTGRGSPAVVLEAGLGDSKSSWSTIVPRIAGDTTVFAYDRPGYSPSFRSRFLSDKDGSRTGEEVATHLRKLLKEAGIEPPFVLVGHSSGGLYVLAFAKLYADDVAGIVLVDGRPPDFTAACKAETAGMCTPPSLIVAMMPRHQKAEVKGFPETEGFAPRPQDLGDIPITVIAATERQLTSSAAFQRLWLQHQEGFAQSAANGRYVEATGSSHYVHHNRPELVADEIRKMLDQIRSTSGQPAARR